MQVLKYYKKNSPFASYLIKIDDKQLNNLDFFYITNYINS